MQEKPSFGGALERVSVPVGLWVMTLAGRVGIGVYALHRHYRGSSIPSSVSQQTQQLAVFQQTVQSGQVRRVVGIQVKSTRGGRGLHHFNRALLQTQHIVFQLYKFLAR